MTRASSITARDAAAIVAGAGGGQIGVAFEFLGGHLRSASEAAATATGATPAPSAAGISVPGPAGVFRRRVPG